MATIERESVTADKITTGSTYVGLENIRPDGLFSDVGEVEAGELGSSKFRFSSEHILYGKLRPYLSKIARPNFDGICSTDIVPIRVGPHVSRDYLFHFLRQPLMIERAASMSVGVNLPRLSPSSLATFEVPVPPIEEQRRIAAILDKAEEIHSMRRSVFGRIDELAQAVFLEMFGHPVVNDRAWPTELLGKLCRLVRGSSPRPQGDPKYFGGPVPRLMVGDITRDGFHVTPRIDSLTELGATMSRPAPAGTVVMAVSGNLGVVAKLAIDACVHDGFVAFLDLDKGVLRTDFLLYLLHLSKSAHLKSTAGAIFKNLTTDDVKALPVLIPSLELQDRFLSVLERISSHRQRLMKSRTDSESLFGSIRQRAFRGEL